MVEGNGEGGSLNDKGRRERGGDNEENYVGNVRWNCRGIVHRKVISATRQRKNVHEKQIEFQRLSSFSFF